MKTEVCAPFLKWAGGKRQLLKQMAPLFPETLYTAYHEPFLGAGAVLFHLMPRQAYINDTNSELINVYKVIRDEAAPLIQELGKYQADRESFYAIRNLDRDKPAFDRLSDVQRAARVIYLNRTCYNGLFRVNTKGEFNVPYGRYKAPSIVNADLLRSVSSYLNENRVTLSCADFEKAAEKAKKGDFVYFDPPYDPLSETSSFTCYGRGGFTSKDQERLASLYRHLDRRGCLLMLSNSDTELINSLYGGFRVSRLSAARSINSVGSGRGRITELLITNY